MAIAQVGSTLTLASINAAGPSSSTDTTGATLLVICHSYYDPGDDPVPSDSKSNTWTNIHLQVGTGATASCAMWYVANPTVGTGHTFSIGGVPGNNMFFSAFFTAWSDVATTTPLDQQSGASNASFTDSNFQPGSITPSEGNELVITARGDPDTTTATVSGYTNLGQLPLTPGFSGGCMYQVQTTATATNPLWVCGVGTHGGAVVVASFKSAGGGGGATSSPLSVNRARRTLLTR